jgi:valyl-tRNA synthetase
MSKSLGNVIDPMDVINGTSLDALQSRIVDSNLLPAEKKRAEALQKKQFPHGIPACGADALRLSLTSFTTQGNDVNLNMEKIESNRAFCNKIWNATKFVIACLGDDYSPGSRAAALDVTAVSDRWILSRLGVTVCTVNKAFRDYNFPSIVQAIQDFWVGDFCDVYIETAKPAIKGDPDRAAVVEQVLHRCVDVSTRLLSPVMPHIAERLLAALPRHTDDASVCILDTPYPLDADWAGCIDDESEAIMEEVLCIVRSVRSVPIRQLKPKADITAYVRACSDQSYLDLVMAADVIQTLSRASSVIILPEDATLPEESFVVPCSSACDVYVSTTLDLPEAEITVEIAKLEKRQAGLRKNLEKVQGRTRAPTYLERVPEHVRAADQVTMAKLRTQINELGDTVQLYSSRRGQV